MKGSKAVLACGIVIFAAAAQADTRDDVLAAAARCGVIRDDRVWLDCVYGAQQPMRAKLGLTPAPEAQQRLVPALNAAPPPAPLHPRGPTPAARQHKKPGFFESILASTPDSAAIRMTSYRYEKGGFVVELENGQEWRQTDIEGGTSNWDREASSYRVLISDGAFGAHTLRTTDGPRSFRVQRVR